MGKILKADRVKFEKDLNKYLDKICVLKETRTASDCVELRRYIETKYGIPYRVYEPDGEGSVYTLCGAFLGIKTDFTRLRNDGIDCNPFTGKWNFHLMDCTPDEAVNLS